MTPMGESDIQFFVVELNSLPNKIFELRGLGYRILDRRPQLDGSWVIVAKQECCEGGECS